MIKILTNELFRPRCALALGFFDGVHIGHGDLLRAAVERAATLQVAPGVLTFDTLPKLEGTGFINTVAERRAFMKKLYGIDQITLVKTDEAFLSLSPEVFFDEYVVKRCGAVHIIAGENFTFGAGGKGDAALLSSLAAERGVGASILPIRVSGGLPVSSSRIRSLIAEGKVEEAAVLLGHPHTITGVVETGNKIGRTIGTPTINLSLGDRIVRPAYGIYAARVTLSDGKSFPSVANFGVHPTVPDSNGEVMKKPVLEAHLIKVNIQLYGETVSVELLRYLRGEERFPSLELLKEAIARDIEAAEAYFA